jgi:hypothetical protein
LLTLYISYLLVTLTGKENIADPPLGLDLVWWNAIEQILCVRRRRHRRIALPFFVLVAVGIVADSTNNKTWKVVYQSSGLHLEAQDLILFCQFIPK